MCKAHIMNNLLRTLHPERITSTLNTKPKFQKILQVFRQEFEAFHPLLVLANVMASFLPNYFGSRLRTYMLRMAGFRIGYGTMMSGMPMINGTGKITDRLVIGEYCLFNFGCVFDLGETITIGTQVGLGHQVMILTTSHEIGPRGQRSGEVIRAPVTIGDGAWLGARCIVLPGVTIGAGSVIAAGTVVSKDIPEDTLVNGSQKISLARWRK